MLDIDVLLKETGIDIFLGEKKARMTQATNTQPLGLIIIHGTSGPGVVCNLLRLNPSSTEAAEKLPVPGWSGFNSILFPDVPEETNIGNCPMLDGNSTESSTIYTVLKHESKHKFGSKRHQNHLRSSYLHQSKANRVEVF